MKNLFIVGAKLMGLSWLYTSAIYIVNYQFLWNSVGSDPQMAPKILLSLFSYLLLFAIALLLIFRTGWFIKLARLEANDRWPNISRQDLLQIGCVLIGLYTLLITVGSVFVMTFNLALPPHMKYDTSRLPENIIALILSLVLILGAREITDFIGRKQI